MGIVNFQIAIAGGAGDLDVSFDTVPDILHFDALNPGPLPVTLPQGVTNYTVVGNAPPGGTIQLDGSGDLAAPEHQVFGAGVILPQTFPIYVPV